MKRARYQELASLADRICKTLLDAKIKPEEGCMVRRIAETQWDAMKVQYYERNSTAALSNTVGVDAPVDPCCENQALSDNV